MKITVKTNVHAPVGKVWSFWTEPEHMVKWNNASDDWHSPKAENDLRVGGNFSVRMEAKDGSSGFDFTGKYDAVEKNALIEYTMEDGRKVKVSFASKEDETTITETFDALRVGSLIMLLTGRLHCGIRLWRVFRFLGCGAKVSEMSSGSHGAAGILS